MPGDGTEVVDVGQILEHHQRARGGGDRGGGRTLADRETAAVDVEAGDAIEQLRRRQVDRKRTGARVRQGRQARPGQQHRMHAKTTVDQPADHALTLGHEPAPLRVEPALLEPPVVGDPRIVGVQNVDGGERHAGPRIDEGQAMGRRLAVDAAAMNR